MRRCPETLLAPFVALLLYFPAPCFAEEGESKMCAEKAAGTRIRDRAAA